MQTHSVFYYPYATVSQEQSLLLKAAALYFDKLYILDPTKATAEETGSLGIGGMETDVKALEGKGASDKKILERIPPEEILYKYEGLITTAIQQDLADPEFQKLCMEESGGRWTLALAKVPQAMRNDPVHKPIDDSMKRIMSNHYIEVANTVRESQDGKIEYRQAGYGTYDFHLGEAIMLNHALVGSLLHKEAVPVTSKPLHSKILNRKLQRAQQIPEIKTILESRQRQQQFAHIQAAMQSLTDLDLGAIPETMSMEKILEHRDKYAGELEAAREKLSWMAREINQQPWTKEFEDEVDHKMIPDLHKILQPAKSSWSSWLKAAGFVLGGTTVVLSVFGSPLTPIALAVTALTVTKDIGIEGLKAFQDWKDGRQQNGLHYLLRLKSR